MGKNKNNENNEKKRNNYVKKKTQTTILRLVYRCEIILYHSQ